MPSRFADWLRQAKRDLDQARLSMSGGFHEWACFAAQQAAEKAVRGGYQAIGADAWGHSVSALLQALPEGRQVPDRLLDAAKSLDRHYIPPRYPNSVPQGAPGDYYTEATANEAISDAADIIWLCEGYPT